jgi:SM-20-related protein
VTIKIYKDFLDSEERSKLDFLVQDQKAYFVPTTTSTGAANYRESKVLFCEFSPIVNKVAELIPQVSSILGLPNQCSQIECQITHHRDGCFYRAHNDNGSPETATRFISYVYYFHAQPKEFLGGQLKIGDIYVEPEDNTIVFFPSGLIHEVLPVVVPSDRWENGRFTVNGWVRA